MCKKIYRKEGIKCKKKIGKGVEKIKIKVWDNLENGLRECKGKWKKVRETKLGKKRKKAGWNVCGKSVKMII